MATIEDRYYQPREEPDAENACRYDADGTECGEEVAYISEVLCHTHMDLVDTGAISWEDYRALADHCQAA